MRQFDKIVQSKTAPSINSLWIKDGQLLWYNNGKWIPAIVVPEAEKQELSQYDDSALIKRIEKLEAAIANKGE